MKASDLRAKNADELNRELIGLRREQFNLRMQRGAGQLANPMRFNAVRRDIARIKTVLTEKAAGNVTEKTASGTTKKAASGTTKKAAKKTAASTTKKAAPKTKAKTVTKRTKSEAKS